MGTDKERLVWTVVLGIEMLLMVIENLVAIAVFWKQRSTLKRTCYLLINLFVADLLVGVGEIENLVVNTWNLVHNEPDQPGIVLHIWIYFPVRLPWRKRHEDPRIGKLKQEQNKELAMTLLIESFLSVLTWLPIVINFISQYVVQERQFPRSLSVRYIGRNFQLANSFINPIVYYARMPEFKRQLENMILKQKGTENREARRLQRGKERGKRDVPAPVLVSVSTLGESTANNNQGEITLISFARVTSVKDL